MSRVGRRRQVSDNLVVDMLKDFYSASKYEWSFYKDSTIVLHFHAYKQNMGCYQDALGMSMWRVLFTVIDQLRNRPKQNRHVNSYDIVKALNRFKVSEESWLRKARDIWPPHKLSQKL